MSPSQSGTPCHCRVLWDPRLPNTPHTWALPSFHLSSHLPRWANICPPPHALLFSLGLGWLELKLNGTTIKMVISLLSCALSAFFCVYMLHFKKKLGNGKLWDRAQLSSHMFVFLPGILTIGSFLGLFTLEAWPDILSGERTFFFLS